MHVVFMGVSGSGKSAVAQRVAERLELPFADADRFHPEANIAKMSEGVALTDEDRRPWLSSLADWISGHEQRGKATAMACSALKRSHRDILRTGASDVLFLHLDGPVSLIAERLHKRSGHFMPPGLLDSQQAALERLGADEDGTTLDISPSVEEIVERATGIVAAALDRG